MIAREIGPFWVLEQIGEGSRGPVLRGVHKTLQQEAAIEVWALAAAQSAEHLVEETRERRKLTHRHLAKIILCVRDCDLLYLVLEYPDGGSLEETLQTDGALPEETALRASLQILSALRFLHRREVVHGDIRPRTVFFSAEGRVKVKPVGNPALDEDTLPYRSPEMVRGEKPSVASDIYAAGATLFEMLAGRAPLPGELEGPGEEGPGDALPRAEVATIPPRFRGVLARAMATDAARRYATARDFATELKKLPATKDRRRPLAWWPLFLCAVAGPMLYVAVQRQRELPVQPELHATVPPTLALPLPAAKAPGVSPHPAPAAPFQVTQGEGGRAPRPAVSAGKSAPSVLPSKDATHGKPARHVSRSHAGRKVHREGGKRHWEPLYHEPSQGGQISQGSLASQGSQSIQGGQSALVTQSRPEHKERWRIRK